MSGGTIHSLLIHIGGNTWGFSYLKGGFKIPISLHPHTPTTIRPGFWEQDLCPYQHWDPLTSSPPPHVEGIFSGMIREEGETTTGRLHASIRGPYFSGETGMDFLWGLFSWVGFLHLYLYQTLIYAKGLVYMRNVPSHFVYKH